MPRKPASKLDNTENEKLSTVKEEASKRASTKKTTKATTKKDSTKTTSKKPTTSKDTKSAGKTKSSATKKVASKTERTTAKKTSTKTATAKKATSTAKKTATKKATTKKATTTRTKKATKAVSVDEITSTTDLTKKIEIIEYYDLPYRYNQTVVKVLAQTPTTLFIYWDISDVDRANFVMQYGEDFFEHTKPVLVIHNNSMHYSFEVEIDDFANSWYLHVNDSNCEYAVELGRRPKYYNEEKHIDIPNNYLHVTSSNIIDSPNDRVLFDKNLKTVYFKDVKTNIVTAKDITSIAFLRNMGRIYDLQSSFTKDNDDLRLNLNNPSSSNPSSTFK